MQEIDRDHLIEAISKEIMELESELLELQDVDDVEKYERLRGSIAHLFQQRREIIDNG